MMHTYVETFVLLWYIETYCFMQAYENALIGGDTSLVLSPDSEFFKFFGNIKPKTD